MRKQTLALVLAACLPTATITAATTSIAPPSEAHVHVHPQAKQDPKDQVQSTEVIALEYAQANEVAKSIRNIMKLHRRTAKLVLIPHPGSNALLLRGNQKLLAEAKDLIVRADVQPAFQKKGAVTQIVIIEHGKSKDLADTLNRFLDTSKTDDLRIEAHAPNNMLLLRGTKERVTDTLDLIARLDRKPTKTQVEPRFVYLEHTRAAEVAATLNRFLDLSRQDGPNRGFFIDANKARNAVILRGTKQQVGQALDLIAQIDVKTKSNKGRASRAVVLKHAKAKDLAATLRRFAGPDTEHGIDVRYSQKDNALLIQGQEAKMQQVLKLIAKLDTQPDKSDAK